jgi:hypothetical protein
MRAVVVLSLSLFASLLGACSDPPKAFFPKDYLSTYTEVRNCRPSADHLLHNIRVLADPVIHDTYVNRDGEFPTGGILVKEERDEDDPDCTGPIVRYTAAKKLAPGSSPDTLDWDWQEVDPETFEDITEDRPGCYHCHMNCTTDNNSIYYKYMCANPEPYMRP